MGKFKEKFEKICLYIPMRIIYSEAFKLGECIIEGNKVVCIVNEEKMKKHCDMFSKNYLLTLRAVPSRLSYLATVLELDKSLEYRFENINFDFGVHINSVNRRGNYNVLFKNCTFRDSISLGDKIDSITFENNKYVDWWNFTASYGKIWSVNNLKFVNENLSLTDRFSGNPVGVLTNLKVKAKNIEIINSNIDINNIIEIATNNLRCKNSNINGYSLNLYANYIDSVDSKFNIKDNAVINNKCHNDGIVDNVKCPFLVYNDEVILEKKEEEKYNLFKQKLSLLETLNNIKNVCNGYVEDKKQKFLFVENNQSIKKILKKGN